MNDPLLDLLTFLKECTDEKVPIKVLYQLQGAIPMRKWKQFGYFEYDDKHIYHMHHNDRLPYDLANILAFERVKAPGTYGVYVIELDGDSEHVYVGQSVRVPEKRLAQHNSGTRQQFAAAVFKRGARGRLRPDLYGHLKRVKTQDQAKVLEAKVAAELEAAGYRVEGGH